MLSSPVSRRLAALHRAVRAAMADAIETGFDHATLLPLGPSPAHAAHPALPAFPRGACAPAGGMLWQEAVRTSSPAHAGAHGQYGDGALAASSEADHEEGRRLIALVELARGGDREAFGQLYDHYHPAVYRFLSYRVGSPALAEDLTADTFFRALRSMSSFRWQGKDFGAWLMTIARNLATDHFKSGRQRLEQTTEDMTDLDTTADGPEGAVLTSLDGEMLVAAMRQLPADQRECLVMRFLESRSIAETAELLGRTTGAIKQLQLRAARNLAKVIPQDAR